MKMKLLSAIMAAVMSVCAIGFTACGGNDSSSGDNTQQNNPGGNGGTSGHKHSLTLVEEVEATCTEDGNIAYYTCSGCDKWFEDALGKTEIANKASVVVAKGHKLTLVEAKAATCQTGNIAYYICDVCEKWFSDKGGKNEIEDKKSVVLPKKENHNFADKLCSVCGYHEPTEGLQYELFYGSWVLSGIGTATDTDIYIADEYEGNSILSINNGAFKNCVDITSVTIPEGLLSVGTGAFYGCSSLKSVKIPSSIIYLMGYELFYGCESLTSLTVAEGNANYYSVNNCIINKTSNSLAIGCQSSVIPDDGSVKSIGSYAFYGCSKLKSLTIPNGITSIGLQAFYACSELSELKIPDSVTHIDRLVFAGCNNLIEVENGVGYVDKWAISADNTKQEITIREGTKGVSGYAFTNCQWLTDLTIADSVEYLCTQSFVNCSRLTDLIIPVGVKSIARQAISFCFKLENVSVAEGNTTYHSAGNCIIETESKTAVFCLANSIIPDDGSVTAIGAYAIEECTLDGFVIPATITYIGSHAFDYCTFTDVSYDGTVEQWEAIEKAEKWDANTRISSKIYGYIIKCKDGDVTNER